MEGNIQDKVGTRHANINGNATRVESSAPLGGGSSHRLTVDSGGNYLFGTTGVSIDFPNSGIFPDGEVVATRIHLLPNEVPNTNPNIGNYWIINNYGTNVFSPLADFRFMPFQGDIAPGIINDPSKAALHVRTENNYLPTWSEYCDAAIAEMDYIAYDENCGVSIFSQFFISSKDADTPILDDGMVATQEADVSSARVYPNPIVQSGKLFIEQDNAEEMRLQLFSGSGKMLRDVLISDQRNEEELEGFSSGIYFYVLEGETFIRTGKLVVEMN